MEQTPLPRPPVCQQHGPYTPAWAAGGGLLGASAHAASGCHGPGPTGHARGAPQARLHPGPSPIRPSGLGHVVPRTSKRWRSGWRVVFKHLEPSTEPRLTVGWDLGPSRAHPQPWKAHGRPWWTRLESGRLLTLQRVRALPGPAGLEKGPGSPGHRATWVGTAGATPEVGAKGTGREEEGPPRVPCCPVSPCGHTHLPGQPPGPGLPGCVDRLRLKLKGQFCAPVSLCTLEQETRAEGRSVLAPRGPSCAPMSQGRAGAQKGRARGPSSSLLVAQTSQHPPGPWPPSPQGPKGTEPHLSGDLQLGIKVLPSFPYIQV